MQRSAFCLLLIAQMKKEHGLCFIFMISYCSELKLIFLYGKEEVKILGGTQVTKAAKTEKLK